jgi:zinc protease
VQYFKRSSTVFSLIILSVTIVTNTVLAQSGRGRPKVSPPPTPASTAAPEPINIPATAAVIKQEQAGTLSRFVLRNGLTLVISEQHSTPIAAAVAYFKADPLDGTDAASVRRLLARTTLGGTELRPDGRSVAELRALGAEIEAAALNDGTAYSFVAPSEKINDALLILADMLQSPTLDAALMRREIPFVIEEEKHSSALAKKSFGSSELSPPQPTNLDDPASCSLSRVLNLAIGSRTSESLRSMTRDQLVEFHRAHYRPDNLIISIAGDVSSFNTLVAIQKLYGAFGVKPEKAPSAKPTSTGKGIPASPTTQKPSVVPVESEQTSKSLGETSNVTASAPEKLRYSTDRADINQSFVSVGFHVPGAESKDALAMEVLAAIAGMGKASRLSRSLIAGQMAANQIQTEYLSSAREGVLTVQMAIAVDSRAGASLDKAEAAMFKELTRLRSEPPSEAELARAKTVLEKRLVDKTSSYLGRAHVLARAEATGAGFRSTLDYPTRLAAVRAEDLQRVAARYLTLSNTSIHEYEPLSAPARTFDSDTFAATVKTWAPAFDAPREAVVARPTEAKSASPVPQGSAPDRRALLESMQPLAVKDFSTLNGPKAFVREDHSQPNVTVAILFQGGRLIEDTATSGMTELMLRSILYGTPRRSYSQLNDEWDGLGADVRIVAEPDFFGFMLSVLSRNADRALKLLRDAIEEPAFRDDDISRARLGQVSSIREARESDFSRTRELLLQAMFPGNAYSLPPHGREEVINATTSEKLADWYGRVIKRQLPVAIIVGDTAGSALVSSQLAEGFKRRDVETEIQVKTPKPVTAAEKIEGHQSEQTTVAVGFPGPKGENLDQTAIQLIECALNGEGGRLIRELRDKQAIARVALLHHEALFAAGVVSAFATTSAGDEQGTRAALIAELERIARGTLDEGELTAARALALTHRTALLQSQSEHAIHYARAIFYQKPAAGVDSFDEQISKVTADDIKRIAASYFKTSAACTGVVRGSPPAAPAPPKQQ